MKATKAPTTTTAAVRNILSDIIDSPEPDIELLLAMRKLYPHAWTPSLEKKMRLKAKKPLSRKRIALAMKLRWMGCRCSQSTINQLSSLDNAVLDTILDAAKSINGRCEIHMVGDNVADVEWEWGAYHG